MRTLNLVSLRILLVFRVNIIQIILDDLANLSANATATPPTTSPTLHVFPKSATAGQKLFFSRLYASNWAYFSGFDSAYRFAWEASFSLSPPM